MPAVESGAEAAEWDAALGAHGPEQRRSARIYRIPV
jgi:hypothetical protein